MLTSLHAAESIVQLGHEVYKKIGFFFYRLFNFIVFHYIFAISGILYKFRNISIILLISALVP